MERDTTVCLIFLRVQDLLDSGVLIVGDPTNPTYYGDAKRCHGVSHILTHDRFVAFLVADKGPGIGSCHSAAQVGPGIRICHPAD